MCFPLINSPMTGHLLGIPNSTSSTANIMHLTKTSVAEVAWNWCLIYVLKCSIVWIQAFYVEVHFLTETPSCWRWNLWPQIDMSLNPCLLVRPCAACATAQVSRVLLPFIRRQRVNVDARLQAWGWRFSSIQMQPFKWLKAGTSNLHWLGILKIVIHLDLMYFVPG